MSKANRVRVDYMPGPAALEALQTAQELHPKDNTQALIDRLVITGLAAMAWRAPQLFGSDREHWQLPEALRNATPEADGQTKAG